MGEQRAHGPYCSQTDLTLGFFNPVAVPSSESGRLNQLWFTSAFPFPLLIPVSGHTLHLLPKPRFWHESSVCVSHPFTWPNYSVTVLVAQSCPTLCDPMGSAHQAPLSMGSSRQGYWSGLPFPSPGDLPNPGIEPGSPALQADSLLTELQGKPT